MSVKSLAGFERVELNAGESRRVSICISRRQLSYWSTIKHDWVLPEGARAVLIGSSSRDIRLDGRAGM
jgi:beta-glucosidase